jgi:starch synthase
VLVINRHANIARILLVSPAVTALPPGWGTLPAALSTGAGGLGDICATHLTALVEHGVDVHLAIPNYRRTFHGNAHFTSRGKTGDGYDNQFENHLHVAEDRSFYYPPKHAQRASWDHIRLSLAFQRGVIYRIIPEVRPDLVHCLGWQTGLIPAACRQHGIDSAFSLHHPDSPLVLLSTIEELGIDAACFWQNCYYARMPANYEETRGTNPLDMTASGVFAAQTVSVPSQAFLSSLLDVQNQAVTNGLRLELANKKRAGRLRILTPAPDASFNPATDPVLMRPYGPDDHHHGKLFNKLRLQECVHLTMDSTVPLFFWPTRLDHSSSGCRLLADNLACLLDRFRSERIQVVFVADGDLNKEMGSLIHRLGAESSVAVCSVDDRHRRLAYGGADFLLMMRYQPPSAMPCSIGLRYGALPIAYDTGAVHEALTPHDAPTGRGSGFLFAHFDAAGFLWAVGQAIRFFNQPPDQRAAYVRRNMMAAVSGVDIDTAKKAALDFYALDLKPLSRTATAPFERTPPPACDVERLAEIA